jgi:hypothetical protein
MKFLKNLLLIFILAVLSASAVQYSNQLIWDKPLYGYSASTSPPELKFFTWSRWFSTEFQATFSAKLNENIGFRNSAVRLFNQVDYSCFGLTHAPGFIEANDGYLFEEDYIHEYTGRYFIGSQTIDRKLGRLREVMQRFSNYGNRNIPVILVLAGGKAEICPEFIPDKYLNQPVGMTNRQYLTRRLTEWGIPFLDMEPVLHAFKDSAKFPPFPKYGMHWSNYATFFLADTLCRYLETRTGYPMPRFKVQRFHHTRNSLTSDYDIAGLFNLVFPLKGTDQAYPVISFDSMPPGKPTTLIIGDSYYIMLAETYGKKMFGKQDFWYYNKRLYPYHNEVPPRLADKSGLAGKLGKYDLILLMVSDINLHSLVWGFPDEGWHIFHPEQPPTHLDRIENDMRSDREWFRFMVKKAETLSKPLQDVIRDDAEYMFYTTFQELQPKTVTDSIHYIRIGIKSNPEWYEIVKKKAATSNIPLEEMLIMDATYTYNSTKKKP